MSPGFSKLRHVQQRLEDFYALERAPDVADFVRIGEPEERETLLVREAEGELEIALILPPIDEELRHAANDDFLQVVEGVSHFVYLAERARTNLPATRLELELQAEVDKFVFLALGPEPLVKTQAMQLHGTLYERVRYLHAADTEAGQRYRLANDLAARFVARLVAQARAESVVRTLRQFYRLGQTEKIHLARAA